MPELTPSRAFILRILQDAGPTHGYELLEQMQKEFKITRSTLYYNLDRAIQHGLVMATDCFSHIGPERKVLEVTKKGQRALREQRKQFASQLKYLQGKYLDELRQLRRTSFPSGTNL